jgi:hypothetical protein
MDYKMYDANFYLFQVFSSSSFSKFEYDIILKASRCE